MPTYVYRCDRCGLETDYRHAIDFEPRVECFRCSPISVMRRIPTTPGVTFKGTGWGRDPKGSK